MLWQSQEQQNVVTLDDATALQLGDYLDKKEAQLSTLIGNLPLSMEGAPELLSPDGFAYSHLSEALEEFSRKIQRAIQTHGSMKHDASKGDGVQDDWSKKTARKLNEGLWGYVEVLEGCVTEFYQQIEQIGFEYWTADFARATTLIKDELAHRIDDVIWGIRRIREQLKAMQLFKASAGCGWFSRCRIFFRSEKLLDKTLEPILHKCNKYLNFKYRKFIDRYTGYLLLQDAGQNQLQKFYDFQGLSTLDQDMQDKYKQLFYLLQLWDQNDQTKTLPRHEPVRALRAFSSAENVRTVFKEYFSSVKKSVFEKSRLIKKQSLLFFIAKTIQQNFLESLTGYKLELSMLGEVVAGYKRFYIYTNPKRKVRSFNSRDLQEERHFISELDKLSSEINELDLSISNFHASLERGPSIDRAIDSKISPEVQAKIEGYLHEMEQPLASEDLMLREGKALLNTLHGLDEMGTFDLTVVSFTRSTLIKALCADWKYHVLQNLALFHRVYNLHQDIDNNLDRAHQNRLHRFERILTRLEQWIAEGETVKHAHDIELSINDIKAYCQDFLAHIQRIEKSLKEGQSQKDESPENQSPGGEFQKYESREDESREDESREDISQMVLDASKNESVILAEQAFLEYLYVFSKFLNKLKFDDQEHRLIRRQLLFVNQYFDEIQRRLYTS